MSYVTSVRVGDGSWKGTTHSYFLYWLDQISKFEDLMPASNHYLEGREKMLEIAVHIIDELRIVKQMAMQFKTQ